MSNVKRKWRAIDLYSGMGGWSLGLKMAGIDVVSSYEWWNRANETNQKNNRHSAAEINIRTLNLAELPDDIDVVVGSPPCTQFSYANRGGGGDIADGLKDIAKFFAVVDHVRPKFWAMENVPRVAEIVQKELGPKGVLSKYAHLAPFIETVDMSDWGLPQRRQRCIVGNFDVGLLNRYKAHTVQHTLGDVITALSKDRVRDPIYGITTTRKKLIDQVVEEDLSAEEARMNREMKTFHPVYNGMAFPDPLDRTARTITATCTRVSRESVVVAVDEESSRYRRLTVRERGCLQGFPITFQFFGKTYTQKLKMIGNAVPPLFTFYIAQSMLEIKPEHVLKPEDGIKNFIPPVEVPLPTPPETPGRIYPAERRFRAAIPNLRFKSGMRFELANTFEDGQVKWGVNFFFGSSKQIREIILDDILLGTIRRLAPEEAAFKSLDEELRPLVQQIRATCSTCLQETWRRTREHKIDPYILVDVIGDMAQSAIDRLASRGLDADWVVGELLRETPDAVGTAKVIKNSTAVLAGFMVGAFANALFEEQTFNRNAKVQEKLFCK